MQSIWKRRTSIICDYGARRISPSDLPDRDKAEVTPGVSHFSRGVARELGPGDEPEGVAPREQFAETAVFNEGRGR
jgi:hypothetical protein